MILVTGATGTAGGQVAAALVERGVPVRAMVRSAARAHDLLHLGMGHHHSHGHGAHNSLVGLVEADFDDPPSLRRALADVTRAFLVTPSSARAQEQELAFVDAAVDAGVGHVVKLSQFAARADSPVRFLRRHAAVEDALARSGLAVTNLRPNLFMQGLVMFADLIRARNAFFAAAGEAAVSLVDVRDVADVAAAALTDEGHAGRTYTLTGPAALTHAAIAATLSESVGRAIEYVDVAPEHLKSALLGMGVDPWQAEGLVEDYGHYRRGEAAAVTDDVATVTGHEPRTFAGFAQDYAEAFA